MRQEDKAYQKQLDSFERNKEKQSQCIIDEVIESEIGLEDLSLNDLYALKCFGHIGEKTKYLFELKFFYNRVDEEIKRRKL